MKKFISLILCSAFLISSVYAEDEIAKTPRHKIDWNSAEHQLHMAGSYAVNFAAYNIIRNKTDMSRGSALIISTTATLLLGVAVNSIDRSGSPANLQSNLVGAAGAVVIPFVFDF